MTHLSGLAHTAYVFGGKNRFSPPLEMTAPPGAQGMDASNDVAEFPPWDDAAAASFVQKDGTVAK